MDLQNSFTAAKSDKFPVKHILVYLLMFKQRMSNVCTSRLHVVHIAVNVNYEFAGNHGFHHD